MARRWRVRSDPVWERQKYESHQAFEAFGVYLSLGAERSTEKVRLKVGKSKRLIERWCSEWGWVERVSAYDDEQLRLRLREKEEERIKNREDRIRLMRGFLGIAALGASSAEVTGKLATRRIVRTLPDGTVEEREEQYYLRPPWSPHAIMRAAFMASRELRKDYDDEPDRRDHNDREETDGRDLVRALKAIREDLDLMQLYDQELDESA